MVANILALRQTRDRPIEFNITADPHGIDTSNIKFIIDKSSEVIHQLPRSEFDLILIDGCHGFPSIFVDLYYAAKLLKIGGTLIIDDMHIFTCQLTARFLQSDPGWNDGIENQAGSVWRQGCGHD